MFIAIPKDEKKFGWFVCLVAQSKGQARRIIMQGNLKPEQFNVVEAPEYKNMTDEEQDMYIYALRYCLTRLSYAPANCADEITRKIDQLSGRVLQVMIQDIGYHLDHIEEKTEYKHIYNTWNDLANKLQTQLDKWTAEHKE